MWLPFYSDIETFYDGEEVCLGMLWKRETVFALLLRYLSKCMEERKCVCPSTQILRECYGREKLCSSLLLRYSRNCMKEKESVCPSTQIFEKLHEGE